MVNILGLDSVSVWVLRIAQGIIIYCLVDIVHTKSEAAVHVAPSYGLYHDPEVAAQEESVCLLDY